MITIRKYANNLNRFYRSHIGHLVAAEARSQNIPIEKHHRENHYPKEFLDEYFSKNPMPVFNENCEPITLEMIKQLPIKMLYRPNEDESLTTDGFHVFVGKKAVGFWTE